MKAIILAAGKGSRMGSDLVKVAHEVMGKTLLSYVLDAVNAAGISESVVVVGHQREHVEAICSGYESTGTVVQEEQLGTGHAVMQCASVFDGVEDPVIVLAGDCPLISSETIKAVFAQHKETGASATVLSARLDEPGSYGRILRSDTGEVLAIREARDCSDAELAIDEINTGVYCFQSQALFEALASCSQDNAQGEFYLTDVLEILRGQGHVVGAYCTANDWEALGVNTPEDLAKVASVLKSSGGML